jgi:hypothetical protein
VESWKAKIAEARAKVLFPSTSTTIHFYGLLTLGWTLTLGHYLPFSPALIFFSGPRKKNNESEHYQASRDKKFCDGIKKGIILGYIRDQKSCPF